MVYIIKIPTLDNLNDTYIRGCVGCLLPTQFFEKLPKYKKNTTPTLSSAQALVTIGPTEGYGVIEIFNI